MDGLQYDLLEAQQASVLQRLVTEWIDNGWTPLGGVAVTAVAGWDYPFTFTQAMTSTRASRRAAKELRDA